MLTWMGHPSLNSIANIWGSSANRTSELTADKGRTITACTHLMRFSGIDTTLQHAHHLIAY